MKNAIAFILDGYDAGKISAHETIELMRSCLSMSGVGALINGAAQKMPYGWPDREKVNLDQSIDDLEISIRTANVLKRAEVKTVRDFYELGQVGMLDLPEFGRKSLNEIRDRLVELTK